MKLCLTNLDVYLKIRKNGLSFDEVKIILKELNIDIK